MIDHCLKAGAKLSCPDLSLRQEAIATGFFASCESVQHASVVQMYPNPVCSLCYWIHTYRHRMSRIVSWIIRWISLPQLLLIIRESENQSLWATESLWRKSHSESQTLRLSHLCDPNLSNYGPTLPKLSWIWLWLRQVPAVYPVCVSPWSGMNLGWSALKGLLSNYRRRHWSRSIHHGKSTSSDSLSTIPTFMIQRMAYNILDR